MKTMSISFVLVAKFYIKNNYLIKSKFNCNENKFLQKIIDNNTFRGKKLRTKKLVFPKWKHDMLDSPPDTVPDAIK